MRARRSDRIICVRQIRSRRAVIGVDDELHGVADVIHRAGWSRIGVERAGRVGVIKPEESSISDNQIRVLIEEAQERRQRRDASRMFRLKRILLSGPMSSLRTI